MRWLALAAALLTVAPSAAQVQKGSITVSVVDEQGEPLAGASVAASAADALTRRSAQTDARGSAELPALDPSALYLVTVDLDGFAATRNEGVLVRAGQNTALRVSLALEGVAETITVTSDAPVVDVTNAITGQEVTLALTESLPTGRSYQTYLQLVPGVLPSATGNPASRSGVNFADINGVVGQSSDNAYYIEGINVTDQTTGTFGANLNTEIIQEQTVLTGGLPAEYAGVPGLVSNVATKSGGDEFSGSVNYFFQDDSLVGDNENRPDAGFSTYDTAFTLGGPIVPERAWFFTSYRLLNREDAVSSTTAFLRDVTTEEEQAFAKVSLNLSPNDLVTGTFLTDPFERDGSIETTILNNRSRVRDQGGERYNLRYTRVFGGDLVLDIGAAHHEGDVNDASAVSSARNDVLFRRTDFPTGAPAALVQLGGAGVQLETTRSNDSGDLMIDWTLPTAAGTHTIRAGYNRLESEYFENLTLPGGAQYSSLDARYLGQGVTAGDLALQRFTARFFNSNNASDVFGPNGFVDTIDHLPNRASFYALLDVNGDGVLTPAEIGSRLVFNSTAGNPNGMINYNRTLELSSGPFAVGSEGDALFVQDTWQIGRFAVNAGVRAQRSEMYASTGETIATFDWDYAPRLSVAYDVLGDGRHRLSAYYGRYYDQLLNSMADFAGALTGPVRHEQVFVNNEWVTYRIRGGPVQRDGFFAPSTKIPYTDEMLLGYKVDLGRSSSVELTLVKRETRDIFEDFFPCLYVEFSAGPGCYPGDPNHPDSLFLGPEYFGFSPGSVPNANFILGTLAGGKRDYEGAELVFRKRYSDNWQMLASYTYGEANGNTNSDSNADFGGDDITLDPRAPNLYGRLPGSIEHLVKVAGSYQFGFGLEVGGAYNWNSGAFDTPADSVVSRYLPAAVDEPFEYAGIEAHWIQPGVVGSIKNESYGTLDLRLAYLWQLRAGMTLDLFTDVFNVLDEQATTRVQPLRAGGGGVGFREGLSFVDPRRFFVGARFRF
jgi:hypothetical protein